MEALEIVLLIVGGVVFIVSFLLPQVGEAPSKETKKLANEEIKSMVAKEMDNVKSHVDEVIDEAVGYAVEKTERSLERLTNEKIMAVNEYSDTVLKEIHQNHEEVMFLYDMLNNKHASLKNVVSEVNKTVKEAEEKTKEAENLVSTFQKLTPENVVIMQEEDLNINSQETQNHRSNTQLEKLLQSQEQQIIEESEELEAVSMDGDDLGRNSNNMILELYKQGKSQVDIAKELGLGVGEVQLVIGLYKNM